MEMTVAVQVVALSDDAVGEQRSDAASKQDADDADHMESLACIREICGEILGTKKATLGETSKLYAKSLSAWTSYHGSSRSLELGLSSYLPHHLLSGLLGSSVIHCDDRALTRAA